MSWSHMEWLVQGSSENMEQGDGNVPMCDFIPQAHRHSAHQQSVFPHLKTYSFVNEKLMFSFAQ